MSSERLKRVTATISADVDRGMIPGLVLMIARGGRVGYAEAIGYRDREANAQMRLELDLPHRLDDEADGFGRCDAVDRGGSARYRRAGRAIYP